MQRPQKDQHTDATSSNMAESQDAGIHASVRATGWQARTHEGRKARTQEDAPLLPVASPTFNMGFFKIPGSKKYKNKNKKPPGSPEGCSSPTVNGVSPSSLMPT